MIYDAQRLADAQAAYDNRPPKPPKPRAGRDARDVIPARDLIVREGSEPRRGAS